MLLQYQAPTFVDSIACSKIVQLVARTGSLKHNGKPLKTFDLGHSAGNKLGHTFRDCCEGVLGSTKDAMGNPRRLDLAIEKSLHRLFPAKSSGAGQASILPGCNPDDRRDRHRGLQEANLVVESECVSCDLYPNASLHESQLEGSANVLLYLHGGGYKNIISGGGHIPVVLRCAAAANASRIIFLEYGLTPGFRYSGQLTQTASALDLLLHEKRYRPEQIILGGDSAGGNLVLSLLAHLTQSHAALSPVSGFEMGSEFKGVFLISSRVNLPVTAPSFVENADRDYLDRKAIPILSTSGGRSKMREPTLFRLARRSGDRRYHEGPWSPSDHSRHFVMMWKPWLRSHKRVLVARSTSSWRKARLTSSQSPILYWDYPLVEAFLRFCRGSRNFGLRQLACFQEL